MAENTNNIVNINESISDVLQRLEISLNKYVDKNPLVKGMRKNAILSSLRAIEKRIEDPSKCRPGQVWDPISGTCK